MKQIEIGTCIPGDRVEEWLPAFAGRGFETFSINFHMTLGGVDLEQLALKVEKILAGSGSRVSTVGLYCNPIQYPEHRKALEHVIRTAVKFGADHVSTFAGALEDRPDSCVELSEMVPGRGVHSGSVGSERLRPGFPRKEFEEAVNSNTGRDVMSFGFNYVYSKEFVGKGVIGAAIFAREKLHSHI